MRPRPALALALALALVTGSAAQLGGSLSKPADKAPTRDGADGAAPGTGPPPADGTAAPYDDAPPRPRAASTPDGGAAPASGTADRDDEDAADESDSGLERQIGTAGWVRGAKTGDVKAFPKTSQPGAPGGGTAAGAAATSEFGVAAAGAAQASAAYFQGEAKAGTPLRAAGPDAAQGRLTPNNTILSDGSVAGGYVDYGKPVKMRIDVNFTPGDGGKTTVCHFPSPALQGWGADPYTVKPLKLPPPAAALLLSKDAGNGFDFRAPPPGTKEFGPGCVAYDARCSFGNNGIPCSGHGLCQSTLPNSCLCANGWSTCDPQSNGCETNTARDVNNCGACGRVCPGLDDPTKNMACCSGKCFDLNGNGGPTRACGRCGNNCFSINGVANCTAGQCALACNPGYTSCQASSVFTTLNLYVPVCVDTTVNPLFCGNCTTRCPFDPNGRTSCGIFGSVATPQCQVTCSWSYPTQCGSIATKNLPGTVPTSNCVNTQNDVNNCGGCGIACPRGVGATSSCAISTVTGKPACSFDCNGGLVPCRVGNTFFCADVFGFDSFNCGGCGVICGSGNICFQGTCVPNFIGFGDFGGNGTASALLDAELAALTTSNGTLNRLNVTLARFGKAALDVRPAEVRPPIVTPAANGTGDVAIFPSYAAHLDTGAAARKGQPSAATSPASAARLAAYLAARPELTSAAGEVMAGEPVLEAGGGAGARRARRARAARAAALAAGAPQGAHLATCGAAEYDGPQPVVVARASMPAPVEGAVPRAPPPGPARDAFDRLGEGAGNSPGVVARRPSAGAPAAPPDAVDGAAAAAAGVVPRAELEAAGLVPPSSAAAGAPAGAAAAAAAAPAGAARAARYGGFVEPGSPQAAAALAALAPAPDAADPDALAAWTASAALAHELEAAADGRGVAAAAWAPAPAAKPTKPAASAPPPTPAPTIRPPAASTVSVADATTGAAERRSADAAAARPGAAERAGPAARAGERATTEATGGGGGASGASSSSFPRDPTAVGR